MGVNEDPNGYRGLLYLDDLETDDWCWDAVDDNRLTNSNYLRDEWTLATEEIGADGILELHCSDSGKIQWDQAMYYSDPSYTLTEYWSPCDPRSGLDPHNFGAAGVGVVSLLHALGDRTALLYATGATDGTTTSGHGLWLARYSPTTGIAYEHLDYGTSPRTFGTTTCTEEEFFSWSDRVQLAVDPASDANGEIRTFVASRACGIAEVVIDASASPATADWTVVGVDELCADPPTEGTTSLSVGSLTSMELAPDGRWLLVGGEGGTGVCAYDTWDASPAWERAVNGEPPPLGEDFIQVRTIEAHPHLDDTWFLGGYNEGGYVDGVYLLQRRWRPSTTSWGWGSRRISGPDLEHRTIKDLDWGMGSGNNDLVMDRLYATATGGGFWDVDLAVE